MTLPSNDVHNDIDTIERRLSELESERNSLIEKQEALIQIRTNSQCSTQDISLTLSVSQKIELFKRLFKGREDVFARRWQNAKGRYGYSFACENEWLKGICNKPRIKCNECPNRAYQALSDQVIYEHLAGKHVVGLYPLLTDNTCFLLATDFDKDDWQDAIKA